MKVVVLEQLEWWTHLSYSKQFTFLFHCYAILFLWMVRIFDDCQETYVWTFWFPEQVLELFLYY